MSHQVGDVSSVRHIRVKRASELPVKFDALALHRGRPVLVLVGGAGGIKQNHLQLLNTLLRESVLALLDPLNAAVVDGGTDSGIMKVMGCARTAVGGRFPLVGVAAEGTVVLPDCVAPATQDTAELEPHHTHIVLVPGDSWGDESPWLAEVACVIADGHPSATLVVNGGETTYNDVAQSLARRRPVLVVAGTGRTADAIAAAVTGHGNDPRAAQIAASPLTSILPVTDLNALTDAIGAALAPKG
jgi:SLOG in TRPM, prokaryote